MNINICQVISFLAAVSFISGGIRMAKAADPYDKALEARVAALERELNVMQGDDKGKGIKPSDVPTFLRAKGEGVRELTISGDLRLRFQYQAFEPQASPPGTVGVPVGNQNGDRNQQTSRPDRYRLRVNFEYIMSDYLFLGFSFASGDNFSNDGATAQIAQGFGKNPLFIDKAFLGWNIIPKTLTVVGGKQDFPFYVVDDFVYDKTDLRVTGLTESFKTDLTSTTKLELIAGQYIFADNVENLPSNSGNADVYWFAGQAIFTFTPSNKFNFKIGPMFSMYTTGVANGNGVGAPPANLNAAGLPGGNSPGIGSDVAGFVSPAYVNAHGVQQVVGKHSEDNLAIFSLDTEANFKVGQFAIKPYAEFSYNVQGHDRAFKTLGVRAGSFSDFSAAVAGVKVGELKKKGDWTISADYRTMGIASVDPNLNDPDWGLSQLNFRGGKVSLQYRFTNWLTGKINYYAGYNMRSNLRSSVVSSTVGGVTINQNPGTGATIPVGTGLNTLITNLPVANQNANQMIQIQVDAMF
jgi:hypothetical protein